MSTMLQALSTLHTESSQEVHAVGSTLTIRLHLTGEEEETE